MNRRSKDQRRDDYLDIGAAIVAETSLSGGSVPALALSHVKFADVADRAGVTKGALYHVWPSAGGLLGGPARPSHGGPPAVRRGSCRCGRHGSGSATEAAPVLRELGNALFDSVRDDPAFFVRISLFSYLHDESVREGLDLEFRHSVEQALPTLERALEDMGRRIADGHSLWDLAVAISALLEGLCLQYRISPGTDPGPAHSAAIDGRCSLPLRWLC